MKERKPARDRYDALVTLEPTPDHMPERAFALVKIAYEIRDGAAVVGEPAPLLFDVWTDETLEPRMPPGSDYWFDKAATDVVVRGSAFGADGKPFESAAVSVSVGDARKRISVFGRRVVEWSGDGVPRFSAPQPVESVPLLYQLAYGGIDARVEVPEAQRDDYWKLARAGMQYDHPGLYPRNPAGKGYLALPGPVADLELPNLEDPRDLLTPSRLVAGAPELWFRQPLPWCFEWTVGTTFPRCLFLGVDAWYRAPEGPELPEVARGLLVPNLRSLVEQQPHLVSGYVQEASLGMVFPTSIAGWPVEVHGMHPEGRPLAFTVPQPPLIEMEIEARRELTEARLTNLVIYPAEKRFCVTYVAQAPMPRLYVPHIHREIPLAMSVNGDEKIRYEPPATVRDRLRKPA